MSLEVAVSVVVTVDIFFSKTAIFVLENSVGLNERTHTTSFSDPSLHLNGYAVGEDRQNLPW